MCFTYRPHKTNNTEIDTSSSLLILKHGNFNNITFTMVYKASVFLPSATSTLVSNIRLGWKWLTGNNDTNLIHRYRVATDGNGTIEAFRTGFEAATRYFKVCHFTNWSCLRFQIIRIIFLKRASLLRNLVNHSPKV